ncbi:PQQ-dependent sugar dehydrogenase [Alloalcanivorax xenomutans]|uniref:PQQ-dependent sugar dehydrogenase n=1 Tax=Alloalcanivorax xenomutans TaxID=1094342 RepID=UPI0006D5C7AE|nr:PQQ-dependent sugar dehydrogenase [Alloalcanivorax xenomutans]PHS70389.1 MAG: glucose dehydrogenase [Alcanivorax sp.]WOD28930.1 PQQ-dependent sugar dehydrogenase [Alloalcanivorax xenomutans]CUR45851.1 PQQ-dependent oxidoreductase, gdhB family [Alloalcanivorax xenomutans]
MLLRSCLALPLVALLSGCADATSPITPENGPPLTVTVLAEGLEHPWSLAFLPGGEVLITERGGTLRRFHDGVLVEEPVPGVPAVVARGQGGLFDVLPHPRFEDNRRLYLSYAKACDGGATTAVGHGEYRDGELHGFRDVLVADACSDTGQHFGGRLLFDDDGHLFLTIGDRGQRQRAQDTGDHAGSVLRLDQDGAAASGNPFANGGNGRAEIWSWGHRNPQGLALHPDTRQPWLNEHGPRGGDEINAVKPGVNYGWPEITYGREYYGPAIGETHQEGLAQPLHYWVPSIAPSGFAFVGGDRYPQWRGDALSGALKLTHLNRVRFEGETPKQEVRYLRQREQRIRDVRQGPEGYLYLLTDSNDGQLLRVEPD